MTTLMQTTLHAKPEIRSAFEVFVCSHDRATNAECLAEALDDLQRVLSFDFSGFYSALPYKGLDKAFALDWCADQIALFVHDMDTFGRAISSELHPLEG